VVINLNQAAESCQGQPLHSAMNNQIFSIRQGVYAVT